MSNWSQLTLNSSCHRRLLSNSRAMKGKTDLLLKMDTIYRNAEQDTELKEMFVKGYREWVKARQEESEK